MHSIASQNENSVQCAVCLKPALIDELSCSTCGYPIAGTNEDQQTFITLYSNKVLALAEQDKKIKTAGIYLKVIGVFTAVSGIVVYFTSANPTDGMFVLITNFILGLIYFSLGLWSKNKPMVAIVTGFSIYILVWIVNILLVGSAAFSGYIFRIIIIVAFIQSFKAMYDANKIKKDVYYK